MNHRSSISSFEDFESELTKYWKKLYLFTCVVGISAVVLILLSSILPSLNLSADDYIFICGFQFMLLFVHDFNIIEGSSTKRVLLLGAILPSATTLVTVAFEFLIFS